MGAQPAAARVVLDIGAHGVELPGFYGHHVTVARGKEQRAPRGITLFTGTKTARHTVGPILAPCRICSPVRFCRTGLLPRDGPVGAVAALFEAGNDLPQMGGLPALADNRGMHIENEVQMLWHDDIRIDAYHPVAGGDGREQFAFHRSPCRSQLHRSRVGMAADHLSEWTPQPVCHTYRDVVDTRPAVVVNHRSPVHAVDDR